MKNHTSGKIGIYGSEIGYEQSIRHCGMFFLKDVLRKMGFNNILIGLIMECIKTVIYSILVNDEPQGNISPTRGIC